jgi:hypothetical protein
MGQPFPMEFTMQGVRVVPGIGTIVLAVFSFAVSPLLWIAVFVLLVACFRPRRATAQVTKKRPPTPPGFAIQATPEMIDDERQSQEESLRFLAAMMIESGYFKPAKIPEFISMCRSEFRPFARIDDKNGSRGDDLLSIEEKKALGLNSRMKYTREFIDLFEPSALKVIEPKSTLSSMRINARNRAHARTEIRKMKRLGFIRKVKICPVRDAGDCEKVKNIRKVYNIDEVPELPIPGCDSSLCRCMYQAIIPSRLQSRKR